MNLVEVSPPHGTTRHGGVLLEGAAQLFKARVLKDVRLFQSGVSDLVVMTWVFLTWVVMTWVFLTRGW
jgi:hypothetical protein